MSNETTKTEPTLTTAIGLQKPSRIRRELEEARRIIEKAIVPPASGDKTTDDLR